ncbi:MAG: hypothetical protein ACTSQI_00680 [Candidatus Helarchaeota archaeon]
MVNWKQKKVLSWVIIFLLPLIIIPHAQAQVVDIWGMSAGSIKTYTYKMMYNGSIETTVDYGDFNFKVLNIWDSDDNNYTELIYSRQKNIGGTPNINLIALDDAEGNWNGLNLINPLISDEIYPIVPIKYNETDGIGMNWTEELNTINTTADYQVIFEGNNIVLIYHNSSGTDIGTGADYEEFQYIRWDNSTGWLVSFETVRNLADPANYTVSTLIRVKGASGGLAIDITLLIGIIGAATGVIAIIFGYIALKKSKS